MSPVSRQMPSRRGPAHCGQSSARADVGIVTASAANKAIRCMCCFLVMPVFLALWTMALALPVATGLTPGSLSSDSNYFADRLAALRLNHPHCLPRTISESQNERRGQRDDIGARKRPGPIEA